MRYKLSIATLAAVIAVLVVSWAVLGHASGARPSGDSASPVQATAQDFASYPPASCGGGSNDADRLGMANPAATYCTDLGYDYRITTATDGSEQGVCAFPDGSSCEEWSFLNGQCGKQYSYCAKQGLGVVTKHGGGGSLSRDYAECVGSGQQEMGSVDNLMDLSRKATRSSVPSLQSPASSGQPNDVIVSTPASFDWRNQNGQNWMTSVKNQGSCGSCWAFASAGVTEGEYNIESGNPNLNLDLSEEYLVSDCYSSGSYGNCCGGSYVSALSYVQANGIPDESCLPYIDQSNCTCSSSCGSNCTYHTGSACSNATCSNRCADYQSRLVKINAVTAVSAAQMKQTLVDKGPLVVAMGVGSGYGGAFDAQGVYRCTIDTGANHAVVITGYNDAGGYWIVKNSWGSTWNGDGYFKVGYGECAIETYAYYVDVPASPPVTPSPTASATPTLTPSPTPTSTRPPTSTATHSASPTSTPTPSMGCKGPRPTGPNLPSQIASNPANNAQGILCADSPPPTYHGCTDHTDSDGDGIPDCVKHLYGLCVYPGDPAVGYSNCANPSDSDGDSCPDWLEMMDVNGDRQVNTDDLLILAKRMGGVIPPNPIQDAVLDVNHDGAINTTDLLMLAKNTCAYRQAHGYTGSCKCSPE